MKTYYLSNYLKRNNVHRSQGCLAVSMWGNVGLLYKELLEVIEDELSGKRNVKVLLTTLENAIRFEFLWHDLDSDDKWQDKMKKECYENFESVIDMWCVFFWNKHTWVAKVLLWSKTRNTAKLNTYQQMAGLFSVKLPPLHGSRLIV